MRKFYRLPLVLLVILGSDLLGQSDSLSRSFGIGGSIQSNNTGVLIPIWASKKVVITPFVGFDMAAGVGSDITLGIAPKFYISTEQIAPYATLRAGAIINKPSSSNAIDTKTKTDYLVSLGFGGEYFLANNFSFFVEAQGNLTKSDQNSDRFGNPGNVNFNLATVIGAYFYFKKRN